jgi:anti-sigma regulatory factor (Ser/Thr protein kinase)
MEKTPFVDAQWQIPAQVGEINRMIDAANRIFDRHQLDPRDRFALNLLLYEALTNAVIHGCELSPSAMIECHLYFKDGPHSPEAVIQVTDPGPGFNWKRVLDRESTSIQRQPEVENSLAESGRGLVIYLKYTTSFEFNETGNQITLHRNLEKGMG